MSSCNETEYRKTNKFNVVNGLNRLYICSIKKDRNELCCLEKDAISDNARRR